MGSRKLIRDCFISKKPLLLLLYHFRSSQHLHNSAHTRLPFFERLPYTRLPLITPNGYYSSNRQFSVFNEFSNKIKGEVTSNKEFQQSVKELKNKAEELKGVREDLKVRVKQKTEQLHKQVDGVWTEAEETAKKVSANVKEKISAAKEEVKESLGYGKQESSSSAGTSNKDDTKSTDGTKHPGGEHQSEPSSGPKTFFDKFRSSFSSTSPKVTSAFQKLKEAKVADLAKKSIDIVKEELSGKSNRRRRMQYSASSSTGETSDRTEIVFVPTKQSPWSKKWEALKEKMQGNPIFKRATKLSEPVVTKSQELAEDLQERWETSDSPVVHKIQDINDRVFGENDTAMSFKEIRRCDPSFSLAEFVAEAQEVVRPVLNAYIKGDFKILAKYCSKEIIERCKAEHQIAERQGIFFDNKILHISEMELFETKMMGTTPVIILRFQTQQIYCVRDRQGSIKEGGEDTIHTVFYAWAMQLVDPDEVTEDSIYAMWRLRDMQQQGIAALI